jgi:lambda family phage tail tape measure protein
MATIENFLLRFKVDGQTSIDKASSAIKNLSDQVASFGANTGPLNNALTGILGRLGPIGLAAGAAGGAFAALGLQAVNLAANISDISGATGIAEGTLLNFRTSVIEAGGKADDFGQIAAKLNQNVQEAASGNEKLQDAFRKLGVFVTDAGGKVRSTEAILRDITQQFQAGNLSGEKYAAAVDLLGKNITKLDLQKLNAIADPVKDAEIKKLDEYAEAIDRIRDGLERKLISFFGQVALDIENAYEKADKIEKKFEEMGRKTYLGPGLRGFLNSILGRESTEPLISREMTPDELAERDRARNEADMAGRMSAYRPRPNERESGGFGQMSEAKQKALADSALRAEKSRLEIRKLSELQNADEIKRIQINAEYERLQAISEFKAKEKELGISFAQEQAAKIAEIQARADAQTTSVRQKQQDQLKSIRDITKEYRTQLELRDGAINIQTMLIGKSEEERQIIEAQAEIQQQYRQIFLQLENRRLSLGKDEQYLNNEIIEQQKQLLIIRDENVKLILDSIRQQQTANLIEKDRLQTEQNIIKAVEDQINLQQQLGNILQNINEIKVGRNFEASLKGLSPLRQQIAKINEEARKATLEAGRSFSTAFDNEDGLTPERAEELAKGLSEIANGFKSLANEQLKSLGVSENYLNGFKDFSNENLRTVMAFQEEFKLGIKDAFESYAENALDAGQQARDGFRTFTDGMEDAFVRFVQTGKLSFKDMAQSILADLARIAVKRAIVFAATRMFGIPMLAEGGPASANQPYIVGEKGPELFVPKSSGTVIPNDALTSGGRGVGFGPTVVNYNIEAVDAASFRQLVARDPSFIYAVTEQGRRSQPTRSR